MVSAHLEAPKMDQQKPCTKKRHNSKSEAIFFQKKSAPIFFRTYLCPKCDYYHVSTRPLDYQAHVQIYHAISRGQAGAHYMGENETEWVYEVDYRNDLYRVVYYKSDKSIKIIEEVLRND